MAGIFWHTNDLHQERAKFQCMIFGQSMAVYTFIMLERLQLMDRVL